MASSYHYRCHRLLGRAGDPRLHAVNIREHLDHREAILELGAQGPPADESIERIAAALGVDSTELLRAAGRSSSGQSFEEAVMDKLDALGRDVREVKDAVTRRRRKS
jgi:hypothetical protein